MTTAKMVGAIETRLDATDRQQVAAARQFFSANGIQFTELDIEKSTAGHEGHRKLGGNGVPLVVVGDKAIHGYDEGELRSTLKPWLKKS